MAIASIGTGNGDSTANGVGIAHQFSIMTESGDYILTESGDYILLESD